MIHTVLQLHPHFTPCLLGAALPVPSGLHSSCCNTEGSAPHSRIHGPASLFSENPNLELARGTQPSWGRAPWSLQRLFCTIFLSHCWLCPRQAQWVWLSHTIRLQYHLHATFQSSPQDPRGGMVAALLQAVTQLLGRSQVCPWLCTGKGWRGEAMGHAAERERRRRTKKNHPCL